MFSLEGFESSFVLFGSKKLEDGGLWNPCGIGGTAYLLLPLSPSGILLVDNHYMHALNRKYTGKDKPTDILSFPATGFSALLA